MDKKIRILIAKPGLDGHDRGAKYISRALSESGYEVIYTGIRQSPEAIVRTAIQEDVHFLGLSSLSGAHDELFPRIMHLLREQGADDIICFAGGIIPQRDISRLQECGIEAIFTPGTPMQSIISFIEANRYRVKA